MANRVRRDGGEVGEDQGPELTREQIRELKRRVADMDDPIRYLLV